MEVSHSEIVLSRIDNPRWYYFQVEKNQISVRMKVKLQKNERMKGRQNLLFKKFVRVDSTSLMAKSCMPILRV